MPTHATHRPGGWMEKAREWEKTIKEKNRLNQLKAEELVREAREREMMAQEDILAHKIRDANRYGDTNHFTLPG